MARSTARSGSSSSAALASAFALQTFRNTNIYLSLFNCWERGLPLRGGPLGVRGREGAAPACSCPPPQSRAATPTRARAPETSSSYTASQMALCQCSAQLNPYRAGRLLEHGAGRGHDGPEGHEELGRRHSRGQRWRVERERELAVGRARRLQSWEDR